jgi:hypothetical protein
MLGGHQPYHHPPQGYQAMLGGHQPYHHPPQGHHAMLGSQQSYYHPPAEGDHHDGLATATAVHTDHHPLSSGHSLQNQLVHPRPYRLPDLGLPSLDDVWQQRTPAIPAANAAASQVTLNPPSLDNSGSMSAMPSVTHPSHHVFDDVVLHSNVISSNRRRVRAPQESSGPIRSSRRNIKLTTAKSKRSESTGTSGSMGLKVIPYGIQELLIECNEAMKVTAFGRSLLPLPESMNEMIKLSWRTVANRQTDGKFTKTSNIY